jgi:uncharacterized protein
MGVTPIRPPLLGRINPVLFAIIALAVIFVLYQLVAGAITIVLAKGTITAENAGIIRWSTLFGQLICILVPTLLFVRAKGERMKSFLRLRFPEASEMVMAVIAVIALQQMLQGYMTLQDAIPLPEPLRHYVEILKRLIEETYRTLIAAQTPMEFVLVVVTVALVPAVCEELLFRGLVQSSIAQTTNGFRAALFTGIIFGAYHLNPFSIVPLIVLGVFFGFLVYRSGSIVVAIAAHFFNNFVACTATYLNLQDDFVLIAPHTAPTVALHIMNFVFATFVFGGATMVFLKLTGRGGHE